MENRIVITGNFESSKVTLRGRDPSPKGRKEWRSRAVRVYIKFTNKLTKAKSVM